MKITDEELSNLLSPIVGREYKYALDFLHLDAAYSLVKFRIITEILCQLLIEKFNLTYKKNDLSEIINCIYEDHLISGTTRDNLHRVRQLGNNAAHADKTYGDLEYSEEEIVRIKEEYKNKFVDLASLAHRLCIENMQDCYATLNSKPVQKIHIKERPDNSWSEDLVESITSKSYQLKMKAGRVYESLAIKMRSSNPFNESHDYTERYLSLIKHAGINYEEAMLLSADVDRHIEESLRNGVPVNQIEILKSYADPVALYKYWDIANDEAIFGSDVADKCKWMLEVSAKRGCHDALAAWGYELMMRKDYQQSLVTLSEAADLNIGRAFNHLFVLHAADESPYRDYDKGLSYLKKGVELNDSSSLSTMGQLYFEGLFVEENKNKGLSYLHQAIGLGSITAEEYLYKFIEDRRLELANYLHAGLEQYSMSVKKSNSANKNVNGPCPCGSGKKYKKCCKLKEVELHNASLHVNVMKSNMFNPER